ncbi:MAG: OmpH family outer membrane protein [Bacteroidia bacterium]
MKKVLIILTILCAAIVSQAQTKVAHINSSELIESMPEADSISARLAKEQESWKGIVEEKGIELEAKYTAFMTIKDDPNVSIAVKEIKQQEVQNLQQQYQELQQTANDVLQKKQQELLAPLLERVKTTIADVAKANGYAYVMDTTEGSGIIFSDAKFDLMPLVKAKLGL